MGKGPQAIGARDDENMGRSTNKPKKPVFDNSY